MHIVYANNLFSLFSHCKHFFNISYPRPLQKNNGQSLRARHAMFRGVARRNPYRIDTVELMLVQKRGNGSKAKPIGASRPYLARASKIFIYGPGRLCQTAINAHCPGELIFTVFSHDRATSMASSFRIVERAS